MKSFLQRCLLLVCLALLATLAYTGAANGQTVTWDEVPRDADGNPDCRECHWETFLDWERSIHGQGLSCGQCHLSDQQNHSRKGHGSQGGPEDCMGCHTTGYNPVDDTWKEDNIHCMACHTPVEQNHPDDPMPTNRSSELCGGCHIQAFFEWQESAHRIEEVACIDCHSQHTTNLRFDGVTNTCSKCHEARVGEFLHSGHNEAGVTCEACHLAPLDGPIGSGSAKLNHTFKVELVTCTSCHLEDIHAGKSGTETSEHPEISSEAPEADAMASATLVDVSRQPKAANPLQFAVFFVLAATGVGILRRPKLPSQISRIWKRKGGND